ncbi:hypothetical protein TI03_01260 [Achromatium sp. WMS1]|nr:hypothetical protein TI03_01260 [Achromatium sp. WMS1]
MAIRATIPALYFVSKKNLNRVIFSVVALFLINNILFIFNAIAISQQYDSSFSVGYYITTSFITRTLAHVVVALIILKIFPVQVRYDGKCPNCKSKLSIFKYVLELGKKSEVCGVCKETVVLYKHRFICTTKY